MESIYKKINEVLSEGKKAIYCVVTETNGSTPRKSGSKMLVLEDGSLYGTIGGGGIELQVIQTAKQLLNDPKPMKKTYKLEEDLAMLCGGHVEVFFDPILEQEKLYIFGGGHVGKALANFATPLGFSIFIIDDRSEISESFKNQGNVKLIIDSYEQAIDSLQFDNSTYIVIVTPEHQNDELVLSKTINIDYAYLGMIGSKRKVETMRDSLLKNKLTTEEKLSKVNMPIGIKMNCETPEEIAISIIAKIVDVRNSK